MPQKVEKVVITIEEFIEGREREQNWKMVIEERTMDAAVTSFVEMMVQGYWPKWLRLPFRRKKKR